MKKNTTGNGFRTAGALLVVVLLSGLAGCTTNPTTGDRRLNLISMDQEIQMGREADSQISDTMGLYPDEALQDYVSNIGVAMADASRNGQRFATQFRRPDGPRRDRRSANALRRG